MKNYITKELVIKSKNKKDIIKFINNSFNSRGILNLKKYENSRENINIENQEICLLRNHSKNITLNHFTNSELSKKLVKKGSYYILKISFEIVSKNNYSFIEKISKFNEKLLIEVKFADDNLGYNCGSFSIKNGKYRKVDIAPNEKEISGKKRFKWLKFASEFLYKTHPFYLGYDINCEYKEEIDANPELYFEKMRIKEALEEF